MEIIKQLYPPVTIKRKSPVNLDEGDEKYFGGDGFQYTTPESNLLYYKNTVVTFHGIVIEALVPQKDLIVAYENDFKHYRWRYLANMLFKQKRVKLPAENKYMLIFDNFSGPAGLAHWYSDCMTRLVEVKDELQDYVALVPYYYQTNEFIFDCMKLLGIRNFYCIEEGTCVKVPNLYVPSHIAPSGNFNPINTNKLRNFMWENNAEKLKFGVGEKIYISRSRAAFRYVTNEKEVTDLVTSYGFKVVYLEDYNLAQKVSLVYNARYFMGIIGAAFSFVHFMRPGTSIMEFRMRNDGVNCIYFALADAMGIDYYYQYGDTKVYHLPSYNFDLTMDINLLRKNIELMLSK